MIRLEQVTKTFGQHRAVAGLSLAVAEGETMVLLGTSGCGKTTTLRMVNRLIEPTSGTVLVAGQDVANQSPEMLRRGIGYVLQHNSLFPHYTVARNIAVVPRLLGWPAERIRERTAVLMEQLHLPAGLLHQYPGQLSGGQQQRVNVARALAADPPVLLMDEPFGALDPVTRTSIRKEFTDLEALKRKTVLMVTHDVEEAFELGDRICLMRDGQAVQTGTPAELLFRPAHPFVSEFLAAQHLSLSLKTVRLSDVSPWLAPAGPAALLRENRGADNVWQILEGTGIDLIPDETRAEVLSAFYRYRQQFS